MANRFWVLSGGTGTWNATATGKWSTTSGGAAGAAVPTAADDVFFDTHSGTGTITLGVTGVCRSLTTTGYTGTFTDGGNVLDIGTTSAGSLTIGSGTTWNFANSITFVGTSTNTITTNGATLSGGIGIEMSSSSASVTLQDDVTFANNGSFTSGLGVAAGVFNSNNKNITGGIFEVLSVNSTSRTANLGSSVLNIQGFDIDESNGGTSTINPGTSQIIIAYDGGIFASQDGTPLTLNNLTLASTTNANGGVQLFSGSGTLAVTGNLMVTGYVAMDDTDGLTAIDLTGNLNIGGSPPVNISSAGAAQVAFNVSGTITPGAGTLADINASGSSTPWNFFTSGASILDGGNNTGITFPPTGPTGAAIGSSNVSGVGLAAVFSVGSSTGIASVIGIGHGGATSIGAAMGSSTVTAISRVTKASIGTALGVAAATGLTNALIAVTGTAIGTCVAQAHGNLNPQPSPPQPAEYASNILFPTEIAPNILNPVEFGENVRQPTEYAA